MDWTALLAGLGARLRPGCTPDAIEAAGSAAGVAIPGPLADLLMVTNGFSLEVPETLAEYLKPDEEWYEPCWSVENLALWNHEARTQDLIPTHLLAFGDNGADEWFCLDVRPGASETVYSWCAIAHEDTHMAPDLATFWQQWLTDDNAPVA